jgi:ribosomal protein S18 acetylase RimI-like enzyme
MADAPDNLARMIQLAGEFFDAHNDPEQLAVDQDIMERLLKIHPASRSERRDENGPIAWLLVIPTTAEVMKKFLDHEINERGLYDQTKPGDKFEAIYLCSVLVLPEYRGKSIAKQMTLEAIREIQKDHPITSLYYWAFSGEGERLANIVAKETGLPLYRKTEALKRPEK